jgi:hypothetical protein
VLGVTGFRRARRLPDAADQPFCHDLLVTLQVRDDLEDT